MIESSRKLFEVDQHRQAREGQLQAACALLQCFELGERRQMLGIHCGPQHFLRALEVNLQLGFVLQRSGPAPGLEYARIRPQGEPGIDERSAAEPATDGDVDIVIHAHIEQRLP